MAISEKIFIQYIKISEFEPFANFWAISAKTLPSNFIANGNSISGQLINIATIPNATLDSEGDTTFDFISGYAPNLTVWFLDSSEAHTFPISSYHWNFGDPFNEGPEDITSPLSNYYTITNVQITGGDFENPCWKTNKQNHISTHTYIMPGTYDVTLSVKASCTNTTDVCARYVDEVDEGRRFYVYVEEIMPYCSGGVFGSLNATNGFTNAPSSISGASSVTAYFMASGIVAGSFPICRMDWNFGDNNIQTVTRYPLTTITDQGLPIVNISAYGYDLSDPRNMVVPHVFKNNTLNSQNFSIIVSAYACNTNSMISCSAIDLISPITPQSETRIDGIRRLIGNRFDGEGNIIYTLEGQTLIEDEIHILDLNTNDTHINTLHTIILTDTVRETTTTSSPTTTTTPGPTTTSSPTTTTTPGPTTTTTSGPTTTTTFGPTTTTTSGPTTTSSPTTTTTAGPTTTSAPTTTTTSAPTTTTTTAPTTTTTTTTPCPYNNIPCNTITTLSLGSATRFEYPDETSCFDTQYIYNIGSGTGIVTLSAHTGDVPVYIVSYKNNGPWPAWTSALYWGNPSYTSALNIALTALGQSIYSPPHSIMTGDFVSSFSKTINDTKVSVFLRAPLSGAEISFIVTCPV